MSILSLTDAALRNLKTAKRQTFFDTSTPSFGVRVSPNGTRTFVIVYGPQNARKWEKIGSYPLVSLAKAREEARNRLSAIQLGLKAEEPDLPFETAYEQFLLSYQAKNRDKTVYEMQRIVKRHLLPKFRRRLVRDITTHDLTGITDKLIGRPAECAATFTAARTLFRWIMRRRLIARSPLEGVPMPVKHSRRRRLLTDRELVAVWQSCHSVGNLNPEFAAIVKLLILTGQRKGQIGKLRAESIGPNSKTIAWPADAMKGDRQHTIPVAPWTKAILDSLPTHGHAFRARGKTTPFNGFSKCKAALDQRAKIAPWTLHDLRRTFSTGLAKLGVLPHIKEMILAHSTAQDPVEAIYDLHTYEREMRDALLKWQKHLQALLSKVEGTDAEQRTIRDAGVHNEAA